jgi:hypothetical protein
MQKHYYMYLPINIDKDKNTRFVVETDGIPQTELFTGKVVARNSKAYWQLGTIQENFVNPISDMRNGMKPSFIPINLLEVKENFKENIV